MLKKLDLLGNPYLGTFCSSTDNFVIVSSIVPQKIAKEIEEALEARIIRTNLGGSTIVGCLSRANSNGGIVTNFVEGDELENLMHLPVCPIPHKLNAVGNNILCNDHGALMHPGYDNKTIRFVEDVLGVEAMRGTIAGMRTVGSVAVATNKGVLCHPHITEAEKAILKELFNVPVTIATANYGTSQIGACIVANSKGAVVGSRTTPIELGRIEEGLGYY